MPILTVATVNVNGVRAAFRKGMATWLEQRQPDIVLLQEVRAPDVELAKLMGADHGWHVATQACEIKGRAGVAIASRFPLREVRPGLAPTGSPAPEKITDSNPHGEPPVDTGRWIEADVELPCGQIITVVSAYLHSASNEPGYEHTLVAKYAHLDKVTQRLAMLTAADTPTLVAGDVNIAHHNVDIANWKGNLKSAGFLPEERAYLDRWFDDLGWVDLGRKFGGDGPGPYTWWTWRGQAFANDKGWRIDYHLANPALAPLARTVEVDRAAEYDGRWSDHAPLVATYEF